MMCRRGACRVRFGGDRQAALDDDVSRAAAERARSGAASGLPVRILGCSGIHTWNDTTG
jgi:hypothetical protein